MNFDSRCVIPSTKSVNLTKIKKSEKIEKFSKMISRNIQLLKKESSKVKYCMSLERTPLYLLERTTRVQLLSHCIKLRQRIATGNSFWNSEKIYGFYGCKLSLCRSRTDFISGSEYLFRTRLPKLFTQTPMTNDESLMIHG